MPSNGTGRVDRRRSEVSAALAKCKSALIAVALMSGLINLLYLTGSFYMLEVYDRVLPSRSLSTLLGLGVLAGGLYIAQGFLDLLRSRILVGIGAHLDEVLSARVFETIVQLPIKLGEKNSGLQPLRDLDNVRSFLSGAGPIALFDLPWIPLYLAICFLFHPLLGLIALGGAIVLVALTVLSEICTRKPMREGMRSGVTRNNLLEASRRNAEVLTSMGMTDRMGSLWGKANADYLTNQTRTWDLAGSLGALSKVLRMMLQSAVLGVGAYLVINQMATGGIIIAGSILSARALAPVDTAIANWKGFIAARQGFRNLARWLELLPKASSEMRLEAPRSHVSIEQAAVGAPGQPRPLAQDLNFRLEGGSALGIIGPSGAGKSSLARLLIGLWQPMRGAVRFDGATLDQWPPAILGQHLGYLPQDVELISGTIAQNICRFEPDYEPAAVMAAARAAGVHEMIVGLPGGYETDVGDHGTSLSAGQAQRIGLARALYGDPFLVVLDEPNSNLDAEGDAALTAAITGIRARGGIAVVIAHRPSAIAGVNLLLVMQQGRQVAFGSKEEILDRLAAPAAAMPSAPRALGAAA